MIYSSTLTCWLTDCWNKSPSGTFSNEMCVFFSICPYIRFNLFFIFHFQASKVRVYFSLYVLMCWNFSGIVKISSPPALKSLSQEEQIEYNKTCTYLRLKVRRSSLALSRSLTENVALPRKQLWKQDSKQKVDITFSLSFNQTENCKFTAVFKWKTNDCIDLSRLPLASYVDTKLITWIWRKRTWNYGKIDSQSKQGQGLHWTEKLWTLPGL